MTISELKAKWNEKGTIPVLIQHKQNRTVRFFPLSLDETGEHFKMNGYWIGIQVNEPLVQEEIKIKKHDIDNWYIVQEQ